MLRFGLIEFHSVSSYCGVQEAWIAVPQDYIKITRMSGCLEAKYEETRGSRLCTVYKVHHKT